MPRSPMSPIFNHTNWDTIDIGIDTTSNMTAPNNTAPNSDDTISQHTDLFPLPPTYSQFHPPYTPSHQPPNYQTFPSFTRNTAADNNDSSSDCYSDHLDLDDYLAPSPIAATAPVFPSSDRTNSKKKGYKPRAPPSLTFFPRPTLTPKTMPPTRPAHQSRHLSTLSAKMPLLPVHNRHQPPPPAKTANQPPSILTSFLGALTGSKGKQEEATFWYEDQVEEELEITPSLVQGLSDQESEKQHQRAVICRNTGWCVFQFLVMVLLGFLFLAVMFLAGKTFWELGWEVVGWMNGREAAVGVAAAGKKRLCTDAYPRFCHLVVGAER
ncbi:hypothetical protein QBC41DRAFT_331453 [Cercophora samala]|uniref:Uncharacterized protein n=1 Tax=Cercophora samala TaxID=330535 RepID=A0AA40D414_9PEZI|nr:hypothetical protein QBC41DRAFT_331453 [Cercophora samala]